jgi:NADH-quinone oxidoreductase subunit J
MTISFLILALIAVAGTAAAMALRNLVHCVLALTVGLVGLAALFLQLGAQFVGFTQILVYIGAVAILAVFAIMMTRSAEQTAHHVLSADWLAGALVAAAVFAVLGWAINYGNPPPRSIPPQPEASVNQIGIALMHRFVLPLEIVGVLLTAALIGAAVLAMDDTTVRESQISEGVVRESKETR